MKTQHNRKAVNVQRLDCNAMRTHATGANLIPLNAPHATRKLKNGKIQKLGKVPLHREWTIRKYNNESVLELAEDEGLNVGRRLTGKDLVLDVDPRNGGDKGFADLCRDLDYDFADCPRVNTGGGGFHLYMTKPADDLIVDTLRKYLGIEFKSKGRQVVHVGSVHPDTGKRWEHDPKTPPLHEAPQAPSKLLKMIARPERADANTGGGNWTQLDIAKALEALPVEKFPKNDDWLPVMMACHHGSGGDARDEFIAWSIQHPDFSDNAEEIGQRWDSLHKDREHSITANTLNKLLIEHGAIHLTKQSTSAADDFDDQPEYYDYEPPTNDESDADGQTQTVIKSSLFEWREPSQIKPRDWLFKPCFVRKFLGLTVAPGGVGKSSVVIIECLAMVTGMDLLNPDPNADKRKIVRKKLRVWYWNGEDPRDEIERRFIAAMKYYGITEADLGGRLHIDSGRDLEIRIAEIQKGDFRLAKNIIKGIINEIRDNRIDVLFIDPFVSSHGVSENDNVQIDRVAKTWAYIADKADCHVHLVHHTRKALRDNGSSNSVEDSRGASALRDAARNRRVLNPMTPKQAQEAGLEPEDHRRYLSADYATSSMIPARALDWFKLESENLGNDPDGDGEFVGVVVAWQHPGNVETSDEDEKAVIKALGQGGPWREDPRAKKWVGHPIAAALGLDSADTNHRKRVNRLIREMIGAQTLEVYESHDDKRNTRRFIRVAESQDPEAEEMDFG